MAFFDRKNIDVVFSAGVNVHDLFPVPFARYRKLENRIFGVQLDIIIYLCGIQLNGQLFGNIAVGIDDFVCAVAEQELPLDLRGRLGNHVFRAEVFQKRGDLEGGLEVVADRHHADVERGDIHRGKIVRVHAVCD